MISIDPNPSDADLSLFPMEMSRISQNGDGSPSQAPLSRPRASESNDLSLSLSLSVHGFETGDMVWGHVKPHPWWPGQIFNESLASPSVRRTKRDGLLLVAFFGDNTYGWYDPSDIVHFAPSFLEKSKQTTSRSFLKAVEDSVYEVSRRAALGLSCMCRNPYNFRPARVPGYFAVDVPGYERGGLYSTKQIVAAREEFVPKECLSFLHSLAKDQMLAEARDVEWRKRIAVLLAFRKATFEEFDDTYAQAFGVQPVRPVLDILEDEPEEVSCPKKKNCTTAKAISLNKSKKKKKNKYSPKRRGEGPIATVSNPLHRTDSQPALVLPSSENTLPLKVDNYVVQKRGTESSFDGEFSSDDLKPALLNSETPTEIPPDCKQENQVKFEKNKKKKIKMRTLEDIINNGERVEKKKKEEGSMESTLKKLATEVTTQPEPTSNTDATLGLELCDNQQVLDDLLAIAARPNDAGDRGLPSVAGNLFLMFRSLVFQKSLVLPKSSKGNAADDGETHIHSPSKIAPPPEEPKESREKAAKVKMGTLSRGTSDLVRACTKRPAVNRQEETSAKRLEKTATVQAAAHRQKEYSVASTSTDKNLVRTPVMQEPLLPQPPATPTNLFLTFPQNSVEGVKPPSSQSQRAFKSIHTKPGKDSGKENWLGKFNSPSNHRKSEMPSAAVRIGYGNIAAAAAAPPPPPVPLASSTSLESSSSFPLLRSMTCVPPQQAMPPPSLSLAISTSTTFVPPWQAMPPPSVRLAASTNLVSSSSFPLLTPTASVPPLQGMPYRSPPASFPYCLFESRQLPLRAHGYMPPTTQPSKYHPCQQVMLYGRDAGAEETEKKSGVDISHEFQPMLVHCHDIVSKLPSLLGILPFSIL